MTVNNQSDKKVYIIKDREILIRDAAGCQENTKNSRHTLSSRCIFNSFMFMAFLESRIYFHMPSATRVDELIQIYRGSARDYFFSNSLWLCRSLQSMPKILRCFLDMF